MASVGWSAVLSGERLRKRWNFHKCFSLFKSFHFGLLEFREPLAASVFRYSLWSTPTSQWKYKAVSRWTSQQNLLQMLFYQIKFQHTWVVIAHHQCRNLLPVTASVIHDTVLNSFFNFRDQRVLRLMETKMRRTVWSSQLKCLHQKVSSLCPGWITPKYFG